MKGKAGKIHSGPSKRRSLRALIGVVAAAVLLAGVVSALSKQSEDMTFKAQVAGRRPEVAEQSGGSPEAAKGRSRNYVTSNAAGQAVVVDRQSGQARPLSPEEARTLAEGIKQVVNRSTDGLVQVRHSNGMVSMDLQGRFQNVMLAKKEADGTVSQSCVDNVDAAAEFFEIDPALLGSAARSPEGRPTNTTRLADR